MTTIESVTLDVPDATAAETFYRTAFGLGDQVQVRASEPPSTGFRGYTLSLVVSQPSTVDSLVKTALDAGATSLKPTAKSFWGYGGAVQAPDGAIWTIATSSKKEVGPATRQVDDVVLLLGVEDVKATKRFYVERGLAVKRSFGGKYVEFKSSSSAIGFSLYPRKAAAKNAGVSPDGTGSHRLAINADVEPFVDSDGFVWETASS
jgi:predicted lactoylglutathione lyase